MSRRIVLKSTCLALALVVSGSVAGRTQPIADRVLEKVRYTEEAECTVVRIFLNFPARYVSHFPLETGKELQVRLNPIAVNAGDRVAVLARESLRPPSNKRAAIAKIIYEGDSPGGPVLTLFFRQNVAFQVGQGGDFRSVNIAIPGPEPSPSCRPSSINP